MTIYMFRRSPLHCASKRRTSPELADTDLAVHSPEPDVCAVLTAFELDRVHEPVRGLPRSAQRIAYRGRREHSTTGGPKHAITVAPRPGMDNSGLVATADRTIQAGCVRVVRCGQHHCDRSTIPPAQRRVNR